MASQNGNPNIISGALKLKNKNKKQDDFHLNDWISFDILRKVLK
jgi:hypothetical protein